MRIIISPAKKMRDDFSLEPAHLPRYIGEARTLMEAIRAMTYAEQKKLWACNDEIASENSNRFAKMDLKKDLTPAILAYDGIQYKYMAPTIFERDAYDYAEEHLRILSAFYGSLRPMDGVTPYRLEMQARWAPVGSKNLYDYWGQKLYDDVIDKSHTIVNLASAEYAKAVRRHLAKGDKWIDVTFAENENGKLRQKGVYVKMARGEMVYHLAHQGAETPEALKTFNWNGYRYREELSGEEKIVFVRNRQESLSHLSK